MNRLLQIVLSLLLAFNFVAANIEITFPVDHEYRAGVQYPITWKEIGGAPTPALFTINLVYGKETDLQVQSLIVQNTDSKTGIYLWYILPSTRPSTEYAIEITNGQDYWYSHYFTISNPGQPSLSSIPNPAPTSSTSDAKEASDKKNHQDSDSQNNSTTSSSTTSSSTASSIATSVKKSSDKKSNGFLVNAGFIGVVGVITSLFM
ncbi:hypothetical protein K7432_002169 [Basidiobolus ranarum]|uniref:Yeast cell wall synthesis Kre9/Knh1-like N-terminal domain-containing protein n=1 Tax=Basidiobolus ranarum TaxID=34480 RepID=A0ABR2W897_9FUNG